MAWYKWLVPVLCLGMVATGWLFLGATFVLGMSTWDGEFSRVYRYVPIGTWRPWWTKIWKWSTTIGFAIILQPRHRSPEWAKTSVLVHETVHIRQFRDAGLLALALAGFALLSGESAGFAAGLYAAGPLFFLANFLGAVLDGGNVYSDSEHERSAEAQERTVAEDT